jgi:hypothetical protein
MQVLAEQRAEAVRTKRKMEALVATEGWKILAAAAEAQVKLRRNEVNLKPTTDNNQENFMKGEASGIETFIRIPTALIDEAKAIIEIANRDVGNDVDDDE